MSNVIILGPDPEYSCSVLDPGQVWKALDLLVFALSFPPEGNARKRKAYDRDLVRRAARVLLAEPDDPLMLRVMGRRG